MRGCFIMDKKNLDHYKHLLDHHQEHHMEILDDMENLSMGENDNNNSSELSYYDNHPAEIASELFDMQHQMALKKHQKNELDQINQAREKMEKGTYGICEECGKDIDPSRLELLPHAKQCIECAKAWDDVVLTLKQSRNKTRPAEEQVLHSSNINDSTGKEQFDDVMKYGSSDTHQDRGGELIN
jgi:YteA family regulatory protein